jgi:hypothetical protein
MRKARQRAIALEAARELLPLMGLEPERVEAPDVFVVFDALEYTQPQSVAYQWWLSAGDREVGLFVDAWERWRALQRAKCTFCQGKKEHPDLVFCLACSDLFEGPQEEIELPF